MEDITAAWESGIESNHRWSKRSECRGEVSWRVSTKRDSVGVYSGELSERLGGRGLLSEWRVKMKMKKVVGGYEDGD